MDDEELYASLPPEYHPYPCGYCGAAEIDGFASVCYGGRTKYYCHPDNTTKQDCYSLASWAGFPS